MTDQTQHNLDNAATDAYFAARPKLDCLDRRRVYEAGFKEAWEAQQERIAALEAENEAEKLMNHTLRHHYMSAQAELAAEQLRVKELRGVVWLSHEHLKLQQGYTPGHNVFEANDKALSPTDNDEALRRYVAGEMVKMVGSVQDVAEMWSYPGRYEKGKV